MSARTNAQNRRMWALVGDLQKRGGLSRDDAAEALRDHCEAVSGARSTKGLTVSQAAEVIHRLQGGQPKKAAKPQASSGTTISPQQMGAISKLKATLGLTPKGYASFCRRTCGQPWPQSTHQAIKVYEGLEAMLRRRYRPALLGQLATQIAQCPAASQQDLSFAASITQAIKARRRLGAGQIGILLKIGARYDIQTPPMAQRR